MEEAGAAIKKSLSPALGLGAQGGCCGGGIHKICSWWKERMVEVPWCLAWLTGPRDAIHWSSRLRDPGLGRPTECVAPVRYGLWMVVWLPLDVTCLELRIGIWAGEPGLEIREFPVSLKEHGAGKQCLDTPPGYCSKQR